MKPTRPLTMSTSFRENESRFVLRTSSEPSAEWNDPLLGTNHEKISKKLSLELSQLKKHLEA